MIDRFINEAFSFERSSSDSLKNLSIGKRAHIIKWLESFDIKNYTINDDLTIDVNGDVHLYYKSLTYFPSFIKFNKVFGSFDCCNNQLTSLEGCPTTVSGYFSCYFNKLTSLEGCPKTVSKGFYCSNNQLTSLKGCPLRVGKAFYCFKNKKQFSEEYVRSLCKVKGDISV